MLRSRRKTAQGREMGSSAPLLGILSVLPSDAVWSTCLFGTLPRRRGQGAGTTGESLRHALVRTQPEPRLVAPDSSPGAVELLIPTFYLLSRDFDPSRRRDSTCSHRQQPWSPLAAPDLALKRLLTMSADGHSDPIPRCATLRNCQLPSATASAGACQAAGAGLGVLSLARGRGYA
jgi:hypothetical protein